MTVTMDAPCSRRWNEQSLRYLWIHQLFLTTCFHTEDGRPVNVEFPGTPNFDGGPDFTDARIRIGGVLWCGDVELHTTDSDWHAHRHALDPHYNRVILHVVLRKGKSSARTITASRREIPALVLEPYIPTAVPTLTPCRARPVPSLLCRHQNGTLRPEDLERWLNLLAGDRLRRKISGIDRRLHELIDESRGTLHETAGRYHGSPHDLPVPVQEYTTRDYAEKRLWEQVLYEGIMEGMGYARNRTSFRRLAQTVRLNAIHQLPADDPYSVMALLFGAAGLLPPTRSIADGECRSYVRLLRQRWRSLPSSARSTTMCTGDWLFFRLRPVNFPTARLAAACYLLPTFFGSNGLRRVLTLVARPEAPPLAVANTLLSLFRIAPDNFWRAHVGFRGTPRAPGIRIGQSRTVEIIVNCVLPLVLLYAERFNRPAIAATASAVLRSLPPGQDNMITRQVREQLLRGRVRIRTAFLQQGVLHLFREYCSRSRCSRCAMGALLGL